MYATRAAFEADCGSLPTETFEEATLAPGTSATFVGPLRAATDNGLFRRRDILPDMQVNVDSAGLSGTLFVSGVGFAGAPSVQVGNANVEADLDLEFGPATDCAGFEADLRSGAPTAITVFGPGETILGDTLIAGLGVAFFGFRSTAPRIARVRFGTAAVAERAEVDNVSFGTITPGILFSVGLAARSATTVPPGGSVTFELTVTSNSSNVETRGLFFYARRDGRPAAQGELVTTTIVPEQTIRRVYPQPVPGAAPPGRYTYTVCIGRSIEMPVDCAEAVEVTVARPAREPEAGRAAAGAYPNPFTRRTEIGFELDRAAAVSLVVYDLQGRAVATLADGAMDAGPHRVAFDASRLPSGVYVYRLVAGARSETGRLTLTR